MRGCNSYQQTMLHRRSLLRIGALGLAGLSLPKIIAAEAERSGKATNLRLEPRTLSSCINMAVPVISIHLI